MTNHIHVVKLYDDRLWVITLNSGTREAVDAWEQVVREYIAFFDNAPERYLVYDTTPVPNIGFTNYLRQRATELAEDNRDATGRVGVVLGIPAMIIYAFDSFIRLTGSRIQPDLAVKIFSQRQDAIRWVADGMTPAE